MPQVSCQYVLLLKNNQTEANLTLLTLEEHLYFI